MDKHNQIAFKSFNGKFAQIIKAPQNAYLPYFAFSIFLILVGFLLQKPADLFDGLRAILLSPGSLVTDYVLVGGRGAACVNAGFMSLISVILLHFTKTQLNGASAAAIFTLCGFSFFGKNLFNSLPIMVGVYLFSRFMKQDFKQHILISLFATALAPLVSSSAFLLKKMRYIDLLPWQSILIAYLVGIVIGFIMPILASSFIRFHQGFNLYNAGFTAGLIGMLFTGLLNYLGLNIESVNLVDHQSPLWAILLLSFVFISFALLAFIIERDLRYLFRKYGQLLHDSGRLISDFAKRYGRATCFLNMAINGALAMIIALIIGGRLSGPVIGGILCITGFSAFGKHPRNCLPVMLGVIALNLYATHSASSTLAVTTTLFATTLSPISGQFGSLPGFLVGAIHMALILKVAILHEGVNLYNNGFAGGFVAAITVPLFDHFQQSRISFINMFFKKHQPRELAPKVWKLSDEDQAAQRLSTEDKEKIARMNARKESSEHELTELERQIKGDPKKQKSYQNRASIEDEESLHLAHIINELISYFQYHNIKDYDLKVESDPHLSTVLISGACPVQPNGLNQLNKNLNKGRDRSLEMYYEKLLSIYDEGDEMALLSVMIDGASVDYTDGKLSIKVWRRA